MQNFMDLSLGAKILLGVLSVVVLAEGLYINYVMGGNVMGVFSSATSCERVLDTWEDANPEAAKDRPLYDGSVASVDYTNTRLKRAAEFKTAINKAVAAGPNFAGKFAVAQWGCGTNCQGHAVVNVESGKIIAFGPETEAGIGVSLESPILITNPKENFPSVAEMQKADLQTLTSLANISREYYVLVGDNDSNYGLQKICTENPFEEMGI
ncbi:MAG: hypothetical protein AAB734_01830 [Patescibacteria group bacterium]